jgi:hypothetical protein
VLSSVIMGFCGVHLQLNVFNCLKLLSITGTNMCVDGKHQTKKGNKGRIAGKGEEKKIWGMIQCKKQDLTLISTYFYSYFYLFLIIPLIPCRFPLIIFSLAGIQEAGKPIKRAWLFQAPFLLVSK